MTEPPGGPKCAFPSAPRHGEIPKRSRRGLVVRIHVTTGSIASPSSRSTQTKTFVVEEEVRASTRKERSLVQQQQQHDPHRRLLLPPPVPGANEHPFVPFRPLVLYRRTVRMLIARCAVARSSPPFHLVFQCLPHPLVYQKGGRRLVSRSRVLARSRPEFRLLFPCHPRPLLCQLERRCLGVTGLVANRGSQRIYAITSHLAEPKTREYKDYEQDGYERPRGRSITEPRPVGAARPPPSRLSTSSAPRRTGRPSVDEYIPRARPTDGAPRDSRGQYADESYDCYPSQPSDPGYHYIYGDDNYDNYEEEVVGIPASPSHIRERSPSRSGTASQGPKFRH